MTASQLIPKAYHPAWRDMREFGHDEYVFKGGRGSLKSTVAAERLVTAIVRDPSANMAAYKKHQVEIESTVFAEISKAITRLNWWDAFRAITSPYEVSFRPTGQRIFFRGLDNADKSKGITSTVGYIQGAWFEETDQFNGMKEIDTVLQSLGRGGPHFQVIYTYNPPQSSANWVNVEFARPNPHRQVLHTTYQDVPPEWLGPFFFHKMEAIRAISETRYRHEYLGEITGTGDEIFTNVREVRFTDEDIAEMRSKSWGMDFGQADPTVLVGTNYIPRWVDGRDIGGTLQIFDEDGKSDARNHEVFGWLKRRNLLRTPIIGDPGGGGKGSIEEIRLMGAMGLRQAYKPGGSVERGINWMRECMAIEIDPERCPESWREFSQYLYDKMRDGTMRNAFPDRDNHRIDAVRYSREQDIFRGGTSRLLI